MSIINIQDLTFSYNGGEPVFEHASFRLDTDWRLGFTGRNGRGKTTLLSLLCGKYEYDGVITSSVEFEYFPYEVADPDENTLEAAESACPGLEYWRLVRELSLLGIDEEVLYRPFSTLSMGERTKVLLAVMFLREGRFMLIDEPTNHLDTRGRELVSEYLSGKHGFIVVSHDRAFLDGCVDHILSINRASIEVTHGNFSTWLENKSRRDAFELAENEKLTREIKRLRRTVREKSEWADRAEGRKIGIDPRRVDNTKGYRPLQGAKSKKLQSRASAIEARLERAAEEKTALLHDVEDEESLKLSPLSYHRRRLVTLRDTAIRYGETAVCSGISFELNADDRIALRGGNGSGKSSIIKLICGEPIGYDGVCELGGGLKISYVPQDTSSLTGSLYAYAEEYGIDVPLFFAILRKLDFSRAMFALDMKKYSAGQRKKVMLARSLSERAHLYVWDEPMNYIDVISRMQIEELILKYSPTLLFVEHDAVFTEKIATGTVDL